MYVHISRLRRQKRIIGILPTFIKDGDVCKISAIPKKKKQQQQKRLYKKTKPKKKKNNNPRQLHKNTDFLFRECLT